MALMIRLKQMGRKNHHTFRLVVTDKRRPRDGKYVEMVGWYDPYREKENVFVKPDRISYWLDHGAILSPKAKALVKKNAPEIIKALTEKQLKKKLKSKKK